MEKIDQLIEIATQLQFEQQVQELNILKKRMLMPQQELLIPFVGEFSAGKTTLLNSLMDSKKLETASKPTTATIFQIRFGAKTPKAIVYKKDGSSEEVDNIEEFKNENADADNVAYVEVHDTSTKVPETTLIIDTPGLSSPDPKHIEVLTTFLPQSDAVMLVSDINQQLTRTILEFIATTALVKKPIYLILTKSGTKTPAEVEQARAYAATTLPNTKIACVDSIDGNIEELNTIFQDIQQRKNDIVANAIEQRTIGISKEILKMIDTLLDATKKDTTIEKEIEEQENDLRRTNNAIDVLERKVKDELEEISKKVEKKYTSNIADSLYNIATSSSSNHDAEAQGAINSTSIALLSNLKTEIQRVLVNISRSQKGALSDINLAGIEQIDLSQVSIGDVNYTLNLNEVGHENDQLIGTITKGVAIAAAGVGAAAILAKTGVVAAFVKTGVATTATKTAAKTATTSVAKKAVNTVATTVATSAIKAATTSDGTQKKEDSDEKKEAEITQKMITNTIGGTKKAMGGTAGGLIDSLVSWTTDRFIGKPERKRSIQRYVNDTLLPHFSNNIKMVEDGVVGQIIDFLRQQASEKTNQMTDSLKQLNEQAQANKESYQQKITQLKEYKQQLN